MKSALKYQILDFINMLMIFSLVLIGLCVLNIISIFSFDVVVSKNSNGLEFSGALICFISGLVMFKEHFWMIAQNGLSRKTFYKSSLATMGVISLVISLIIQLATIMFQTVESFGEFYYRSIIQMFYPTFSKNIVIYTITNILFIASFAFAFFTVGYLISSLFYIFNKIGRIFLAAGLPIIIFFVLPVTYSYLEPFWVKVFDVLYISFGGQKGNPMYAVIIFLIISLVFAGCSYPVVRKAEIK